MRKNLITDLTTLPVPVPGGSPGSSPSTICGTLYSQSELARLNNYFRLITDRPRAPSSQH